MVDFMEKLRLRGKAEEDLYFAELDRKLIEAMHEKMAHEKSFKSVTGDDEIVLTTEEGRQK